MVSKMTMPNFLIIGVPKAGTTSLYRYLKQHPQIYMSPLKEPRFFAYEGGEPDFGGPPGDRARRTITDLATYQALFDGVSNETAIGEASVIYLYEPGAVGRIKHYIPDAKLIAILRDPVERAYSQWWARRANGREPLGDFAQAMRAEKERIESNWHPSWHYKQRGFYGAQLKRYFDAFDRNQIRIYLHEEFHAASATVVKDAYRLLGVDETFEPDVSSRYHVVRRSKAWEKFLKRPHPILRPFLPHRLRRRILTSLREHSVRAPRQPLPPELRRELIEEYREDILRLQDLIQRDLSAWLRSDQ